MPLVYLSLTHVQLPYLHYLKALFKAFISTKILNRIPVYACNVLYRCSPVFFDGLPINKMNNYFIFVSLETIEME